MVEMIWHAQPLEMFSYAQNLSTLTVDGCGNLKYLSSSSSVVHLKRLKICNCKMMEEVMVREGLEEEIMSKTILHQLEFLALKDLPKLTRFCTSDLVECHALEKLCIQNCPEMRTFVSNSATSNMAFSSELDIVNSALFNDKFSLQVSFPNLTTLIVDGCDNLKILLSLSSVVHLKRLKICNCKMMEEVMVKEGLEEEIMSKMLLHQLESLELMDLPKLTRFCTSNLVECPVLKELRIQNCPQMRTFVSNYTTSNMASSSELDIINSALFDEKVAFPNLEQLGILNMDNLKMIWHNELHSDSFCKINALTVENCEEVLKIFPSMLLRGLRNLQDLVIRNCDLLQEVFDLQELIKMKESVAIRLRTLLLEGLPKLKHVWNEDPLGLVLFDNLSSVRVQDCPNLKIIFPASIAKNLPQLKTLNTSSSGVEEIGQNLNIFCSASENMVETNMENQPMIKVLQPHFSFGKLDQALQSLEVLTVWCCDSLITFAPSSASFQNLTRLTVWKCNGLVSLVTSSTAKSLVQLTKMSIEACDRLKEIVANEGNESKEDIIFSKLERLKLDRLPSLVSFCSADHSFKFPSLTEVFMEKCPKMQVFSIGVLSTPRLLVVRHDGQECWNGNLNDTVQQLFAEMNAKED
ncbi:disease resistance protein RPP5 [Hevea brasiliensis]|uniref:disease resistance protein RPP5 n=1 Tax=Hevea brasiliensis TaxID=3981 RepID=UPI0025F17865|nr:disease resistance protein RPP5 [Hevea brasiliensis]